MQAAAAGWIALLTALWSLSADLVLAQDSSASASQASYEVTVRRALREFELEHWAEAMILFSQAYAMRPNARTLRGLGLTSYEARRYVAAIGYLERALAHNVQPLAGEMRQQVERLLAEAKVFVTRAQIAVEPRIAEIQIDGGVGRTLGSDAVVLLDPGSHEIAATAVGFQSETRRVTAEGGNQLLVKFKLTPAPGTLEPATNVAAPSIASNAGRESPFINSPVEHTDSTPLGPWIVVAASGVVAVAGGVLLGVAMANKARVEYPEPRPVWSDYEGAYDTGNLLFPLSAVMVGIGLAGVAGGLVWRFWPSPGDAISATTLLIQPGSIRLAGRM